MPCLCLSAQFYILRAGEPLLVWLPMTVTSQEPSLDCELFEDCGFLLSLRSPAKASQCRWPFIAECMDR